MAEKRGGYLNQRGFAHLLLIFFVTAILGVLGFALWRTFQAYQYFKGTLVAQECDQKNNCANYSLKTDDKIYNLALPANTTTPSAGSQVTVKGKTSSSTSGSTIAVTNIAPTTASPSVTATNTGISVEPVFVYYCPIPGTACPSLEYSFPFLYNLDIYQANGTLVSQTKLNGPGYSFIALSPGTYNEKNSAGNLVTQSLAPFTIVAGQVNVYKLHFDVPPNDVWQDDNGCTQTVPGTGTFAPSLCVSH